MKIKDLRFKIQDIVIVLITLTSVIGFVYHIYAHPSGTNIDTQTAGYKWAWNDTIGWVNMHDSHTIVVSGDKITGWATSSVGEILFDCATTPGGNICGNPPFVTNNDQAGHLSGWAWNDAIGWISWCGNTTTPSTWSTTTARWVCPQPTTYRAHIDPSGNNVDSFFFDYGWNDAVGWFDFNCANKGICNPPTGSDFKVQTGAGSKPSSAVIVSNVYDIGSTTGIFNTVTWKGSQPGGTKVQFQFATATTTAGTPWADSNYGTWITVAANVPRVLTKDEIGVEVEGRRYMRYKVSLESDTWQTASPRIDDILINWSP